MRKLSESLIDLAGRVKGLKEKNAEQAVQAAEDDAVAAVTLAAYCLDTAERAVVRAELARGEADELAGKS